MRYIGLAIITVGGAIVALAALVLATTHLPSSARAMLLIQVALGTGVVLFGKALFGKWGRQLQTRHARS